MILHIIIGILLGTMFIFLFGYLLKQILVSMDNDVLDMVKDVLTEEEFEEFKKDYYSLEETFEDF